MAPKINRPDILQSLSGIEKRVEDCIIEFAVLGYVDVARRLVSLRNKHYPVPESKTNLNALWMLWQETGSWPDGELQKWQDYAESIDEVAGDFFEALSYGLQDNKNKKFKTAKGLKELMHAVQRMSSEEADSTSTIAAIEKSAGLVMALDLALLLEMSSGHDKEMPRSEDILAQIAGRLHCNRQLSYLAYSKRTWSILREGALAKALGVKNEKVLRLAQEAEDAFRTRWETGPQDPDYGSMLEKLRRISEYTLGSEHARQMAEETDEEFVSVLREPASPEDIAALERRLNVTLPDDYKQFLLASNGLGPTLGHYPMDPPLHSTKDVKWLIDSNDYDDTQLSLDLLNVSIGLVARHYLKIVEDGWPTIDHLHGIDIGREDIFEVWLLPPETVKRVQDACCKICDSKEASNELKATVTYGVKNWFGDDNTFDARQWCVVDMVEGDMECYPSFEAFINKKVAVSEMEDGEDLGNHCFAYSCR